MSPDMDLYRLRNCIRGPGDPLYKYLRTSITEALRIRFLVASLLNPAPGSWPNLRRSRRTGTSITILTGTYLCNTEPYALEYLKEKAPSLNSGYTPKPAVPSIPKPTSLTCRTTVKSSSARPTSPGPP